MERLAPVVNRAWHNLFIIFVSLMLALDLLASCTHIRNVNRSRTCPRHCHCRNVTIDCSNSNMVQLGQQFPYRGVKLVLDHNKISKIPSNVFRGLSQLDYLSVQDNNLTVVEEEAFSGLESLQRMFLDKNNLHQLPASLFEGTPKLGNLSLSSNALSLRALNDTLYHLQNLEGLNLRNNKLDEDESFPDGFALMTNLRILELGSNDGMRNITENYFSALNDLRIEYLSLNSCPIIDVHTEAFMKLRHLVQLDISQTTMPLEAVENIFKGLRNSSLNSLVMEYLFVYSDLHEHVTPDFFFHLRNTGLSILDMEGNYGGFLSNLHSGLFRWIKDLRHLTLDRCHITSIAHATFKGLHKLKRLSLRHNFISCMNDCGFISQSPMLRNLMVLDLSDNVITNSKGSLRFRSEAFPKLHHLYLQNNRISFLEVGMFDLKNLRTLDLSGNPIHHIESETFRSLHSLETLTITGSIYLQVLPNGTFKGLKNLLHLRLNNNQLRSIHPRAFNGLHSLEVLEMNGNLVGGQGNYGDLHISAELRRLRRLDLGNNRLEVLPVNVIAHQPRLRVLLLHYNRIAFVDKASLQSMKELETLDLSYNDIMEVEKDTFQQLPSLRKLDMAGNPFLCTCNIKDFLDWLRETEVKLTSVDQHKCAGPLRDRGKNLFAYSPSAWECQIKAVLVPLLTVMGISVLAVFVTCLVYRCFCKRHDHASGEENKDRKGRNWNWIRELLPVSGEMSPSGSEEGNVEDPLIEGEHELCQDTMCQESQTEENHIL